MRGRRFGQPERATQPRHGELHDAGRQRAALGADEQRTRLRKIIRAERDIIGDEFFAPA